LRKKNVEQALEGIIFMLDENKLVEWLSNYKIETIQPKKIGIIMLEISRWLGFMIY
jgi:hypothetical protein